MKNTYKVIWSEEAISNLKGVIDYLENHWTKKEITKFAQLLDKQLRRIEKNPHLFAKTEQSNGMRKAVLTKQLTLYYSMYGDEIRIITLFDNRQNPTNLMKWSKKK